MPDADQLDSLHLARGGVERFQIQPGRDLDEQADLHPPLTHRLGDADGAHLWRAGRAAGPPFAGWGGFDYTYTMKKYLLLLLPLLLPGCVSVVSRAVVDPQRTWKHEEQVTLTGLNRGVVRGVLYYRGKEFPDYFDSLVIGARRFNYRAPTGPAEPAGYQDDPRWAAAANGLPGPLAPADLARGWYLAGPQERRSGTPEQWVWVKRQSLEAFLDPSALSRFARVWRLTPVGGGGYRPEEGTPLISVRLGVAAEP